MKLKIFLAAGLMAMVAVSCNSEPKTEEKKPETVETTPETPVASAEVSIEKNWVLEEFDASAAMEGLPKEKQDKMKENMSKMLPDLKGKMGFDFKAGGKVSATAIDGSGKLKTTEGTWSLSEDKKTLTMDMEGKKEDVPVEITADKLKIELKKEKISMIFIPKS